jgi:putative phosphoesterase
MRIGVLSDTHDNLDNTIYVLNKFREREIGTLIHCGDLTSLQMVPYYEGFRVIYTTGNMDYTTGAIEARFKRMRTDNYVGLIFRGNLDGVSVAATHSHIHGKVMDLVREKRFKYIFHGHSHQRRDEIVRGVRIINPGALDGLNKGSPSFCIVDLKEEDVQFFTIP